MTLNPQQLEFTLSRAHTTSSQASWCTCANNLVFKFYKVTTTQHALGHSSFPPF